MVTVGAFSSAETEIPIAHPIRRRAERMRVMIEHIELICRYKGERVGMREARKHAAWYIKGIRGAAVFRQEVGMLSDMKQLHELAKRVIESAE
jgi:tRNA-dihydrouridine synthase